MPPKKKGTKANKKEQSTTAPPPRKTRKTSASTEKKEEPAEDQPREDGDATTVEQSPAIIKEKRDVGAPNQTLYIKNLSDKLRKEELKKDLYLLFSAYGHIIDIITLKSPKMRGQAHVAFSDLATATLALKALQGFNFFGKEMDISFAKTKSNTIAKLDGTYKMPSAPPSLEKSNLPLAPFEQFNGESVGTTKRSRDGEDEEDD